MTHIRQQIRAHVAARLANLPTTADRVYVGRTRALGADYDPTLLIYSRDESSARVASKAGRATLERVTQLYIEARVTAAAPPDDLLDQIAAEVEIAMAADTRLGGLALDSVPAATSIETSSDGGAHIGSCRLEYRVRYWAPQLDPGDTDY